TMTEGLVGLCDAYYELSRRDRKARLAGPRSSAEGGAEVDRSLDRPLRASIAELAKLSRLLPIAGPCADNRVALRQLRAGSRWRAARTFRRALAGATRFELPYERALAHAGLAACTGAADHTNDARAGFTFLGASWRLTTPSFGI
ncbi:MAG: hypothetical protein H0T46_34215, partial [Deltaproteobacteria bacterium]|nr:hypothetical protein [Deltaproteobacteria bacterium]